MHSESQRLIRGNQIRGYIGLPVVESTIKLPRYQPKTKTLDSFLTKLKTKQSCISMDNNVLK